MRKNRMMRLASALLILTMVTTCAISGTFAKYTTSATATDKARVAYWGFQSSNSMDFTNLFSGTYTNVKSQNGEDVIAPGTAGSVQFSFAYDESTKAYDADMTMSGPEVDYNFTVAVEEHCDALIEANKNIQWKLTKKVGAAAATDVVTWGTWDDLITAIKGLSGDATDGAMEYKANTLPSAFTAADEVYTIEWQWLFTSDTNKYDHDKDHGSVTAEISQDEYDTFMANAAAMDDCSITITITATQIGD